MTALLQGQLRKILKKQAETNVFVDFCNNAMSHTNFGQNFEKWDSRRANELKAAQKMGLLTPDEIQAYSGILREESVVEEKKKDFLEKFLENPTVSHQDSGKHQSIQ